MNLNIKMISSQKMFKEITFLETNTKMKSINR